MHSDAEPCCTCSTQHVGQSRTICATRQEPLAPDSRAHLRRHTAGPTCATQQGPSALQSRTHLRGHTAGPTCATQQGPSARPHSRAHLRGHIAGPTCATQQGPSELQSRTHLRLGPVVCLGLVGQQPIQLGVQVLDYALSLCLVPAHRTSVMGRLTRHSWKVCCCGTAVAAGSLLHRKCRTLHVCSMQ